jgi:hypothetical protein
MSIKKYIGFYVCALALLLQTVSIGVCDNPVRVLRHCRPLRILRVAWVAIG